MKLITNAMLKGACPEQRKQFRKMFPDGAPVTVAAAMKAFKAGIDVFWAINILPEPLDDEYWTKCKPLLDEYDAKRKPLEDEYQAKRKPLLDEYEAKRKPLYDEYDAKCKPLYDEYDAKCIKMLVSCLRKVKEAK